MNKNVERYTLIGIFLALFVISIFILQSVIFVIAYSFILGYVLMPLYRFFMNRNIDKHFSALFSLGGFLVFILIPLLLFLYYMAVASISLVFRYQYFLKNPDALDESVRGFLSKVLGINFDLNLSNFILEFIKEVVNAISSFFYSIPLILLYFFVIIFITYYILIKNEEIKEYICNIPIERKKIEDIINHIKLSLNTLLKGYFLTGLIQAMAALIIYIALGLPNVMIFTFLTFIFALVPYVGTPVIWVPLCIYLFFTGANVKAIILFMYGTFVISSVDNFLRPVLMSRGEGLNTPLVFIGLLGGVAAIGVPGLILGPVILSTTTYVMKYLKKETGNS